MANSGSPTNFVDLQAAFYNAFSQALGFSPGDPFQVVQPSPPLVGGAQADQLLWNYFNAIPPYSLTQNTILSGGNQFLADYQGVMSALQGAPNNFQSTIGPSCYKAYSAAIKAGQVKAGDPLAFRNWALVNSQCSGVAVSGASALAAAMLDPIFAAQMHAMAYKPAGSQNVDFVPGYATMMRLLAAAPSRSIPQIGTSQWNWDVTSSWTSGSDDGFFGLWGGSSSSSSTSQKFASSGVTLSASFGNVLQFSATPGDWYSSAALGLAYNNQSGPPWVPDSPINWQNTFGSNGNMQRFLSTLVIVQDMNVTVTSLATYSESEQQTIRSQSSAGLWPFYTQSSSSGSNTDVGFNSQGNMTVTITSQPGVAVVVGCIVLPAAQYLGHESERSRLLSAARARR
ncbi:hypothetical protein [Nannocystis pusilla]|uniref:Uncharacterized protein n=1 Tax=Nannocystis pusilla TaxID=889268 RepID=A0ABS7U3B5_9BACT|nr:hypothetical protein [Nannocystis pusilla]MBZ5714921.1 hypothetical protein [Nannocystis pusilla]